MKLGDKLTKCNDSLTVNMYDNGFMVEVGGRDSNEDWKNAKVMCNTLEEVFAVIREASEMERD
jgi:ketol-acid reductoisomerase